MAEFTEVMKKRKEMHEYYSSTNGCTKCPLSSYNNGHIDILCYEFVQDYPEEAEQIIMAWEKPIDWTKVPIDTKILVTTSDKVGWTPRYFAKYEDGKVYAWEDGATSWSVSNKDYAVYWKYAKLAEVKE